MLSNTYRVYMYIGYIRVRCGSQQNITSKLYTCWLQLSDSLLLESDDTCQQIIYRDVHYCGSKQGGQLNYFGINIVYPFAVFWII